MHTHMHTHAHTCTHMHPHMHTRMHRLAHTHMRTHACTPHAHTHAHTRMHACTHTCTYKCTPHMDTHGIFLNTLHEAPSNCWRSSNSIRNTCCVQASGCMRVRVCARACVCVSARGLPVHAPVPRPRRRSRGLPPRLASKPSTLRVSACARAGSPAASPLARLACARAGSPAASPLARLAPKARIKTFHASCVCVCTRRFPGRVAAREACLCTPRFIKTVIVRQGRAQYRNPPPTRGDGFPAHVWNPFDPSSERKSTEIFAGPVTKRVRNDKSNSHPAETHPCGPLAFSNYSGGSWHLLQKNDRRQLLREKAVAGQTPQTPHRHGT